MKKKVPVVQVTTPEGAGELAGLPLEATVAMADVAGAMREGLLAFATSAGLVVMQQMLTAELTAKIGPKHAKLPAEERVGNWHGTTQGQVVLGSQKVTVERPRGRLVDGGEIGLDTWDVFASRRTCWVRSWSSGCSPVSPPVDMSMSLNRSVPRAPRRRSRRCRAGSRRPRRRRCGT